MTNTQINKKIAKLRKLQEDAAKIKKQVEAIEDALKEELIIQDTKAIDTGAYRIFWTGYPRSYVDNAKLKEDGLYDKYSYTKQVNRFTINDVKVV